MKRNTHLDIQTAYLAAPTSPYAISVYISLMYTYFIINYAMAGCRVPCGKLLLALYAGVGIAGT